MEQQELSKRDVGADGARLDAFYVSIDEIHDALARLKWIYAYERAEKRHWANGGANV